MSNIKLSDIHAQTSAILAELYEERGQPRVLDDSFTKEYFSRVAAFVNPSLGSTGSTDDFVLLPHSTDAHLVGQGKDLIDVVVAVKSEKFLVKNATPGQTIKGTSQRFGSTRGKGTYLMTDIKGIPNITMKTGGAVVTFIGLPTKVTSETGSGEWVKV